MNEVMCGHLAAPTHFSFSFSFWFGVFVLMENQLHPKL